MRLEYDVYFWCFLVLPSIVVIVCAALLIRRFNDWLDYRRYLKRKALRAKVADDIDVYKFQEVEIQDDFKAVSERIRSHLNNTDFT